MSERSIESILTEFIQGSLLHGRDIAPLGPETPLVTSGLLDSLSTIELLVFLTDRFGVSLEAHEVDWTRLDTVSAIAQLIRQRAREAGL